MGKFTVWKANWSIFNPQKKYQTLWKASPQGRELLRVMTDISILLAWETQPRSESGARSNPCRLDKPTSTNLLKAIQPARKHFSPDPKWVFEATALPILALHALGDIHCVALG